MIENDLPRPAAVVSDRHVICYCINAVHVSSLKTGNSNLMLIDGC